MKSRAPDATMKKRVFGNILITSCRRHTFVHVAKNRHCILCKDNYRRKRFLLEQELRDLDRSSIEKNALPFAMLAFLDSDEHVTPMCKRHPILMLSHLNRTCTVRTKGMNILDLKLLRC